jgi:hypothetical protein
MIFPTALLALAAIWTAFVVELVMASAPSGGSRLVAFGTLLGEPGPAAGVVVLCAVSASAALAMVTAIAYGRGRRLERRMAAELDDGWGDLSRRAAEDAARIELLTWRVAELQTFVDTLLAERQEHDRRLVVVPDERVSRGA